jgi:hypothetical protein
VRAVEEDEEDGVEGLEVMLTRSPFSLLYPLQIASIYKFKSLQLTSPATTHTAPLPGGRRHPAIYLSVCVRALLYSSSVAARPGLRAGRLARKDA